MTGRRVGIRNAEVVTKSYPEFWSDMRKAGFEIEERKEHKEN
jgi:5-enolpyruvylshikimate-3-phosphate synthase